MLCHAIAPRDRLVRLGVEFAQPKAGLEDRSGGLERRRHLPARSAPCGPEIDEQWNVGAAGMCIEIGCGQGDGMPGEEPLLAGAASPACTEPGHRHAIGGGAMRADDDAAVRGGVHCAGLQVVERECQMRQALCDG